MQWSTSFTRRTLTSPSEILAKFLDVEDEDDPIVLSLIDTAKEASINALSVYKHLSENPSQGNFCAAYAIEKVTFAMNFILVQLCNRISETEIVKSPRMLTLHQRTMPLIVTQVCNQN